MECSILFCKTIAFERPQHLRFIQRDSVSSALEWKSSPQIELVFVESHMKLFVSVLVFVVDVMIQEITNRHKGSLLIHSISNAQT